MTHKYQAALDWLDKAFEDSQRKVRAFGFEIHPEVRDLYETQRHALQLAQIHKETVGIDELLDCLLLNQSDFVNKYPEWQGCFQRSAASCEIARRIRKKLKEIK